MSDLSSDEIDTILQKAFSEILGHFNECTISVALFFPNGKTYSAGNKKPYGDSPIQTNLDTRK